MSTNPDSVATSPTEAGDTAGPVAQVLRAAEREVTAFVSGASCSPLAVACWDRSPSSTTWVRPPFP